MFEKVVAIEFSQLFLINGVSTCLPPTLFASRLWEKKKKRQFLIHDVITRLKIRIELIVNLCFDINKYGSKQVKSSKA